MLRIEKINGIMSFNRSSTGFGANTQTGGFGRNAASRGLKADLATQSSSGRDLTRQTGQQRTQGGTMAAAEVTK
jgi:hypothetical protein